MSAQEAFEAWTKSSPTYRLVVENEAFNAFCFEAYKAGSSSRDEQVKQLVEALDWCVVEINRDSPAVINGKAALKAAKESGL